MKSLRMKTLMKICGALLLASVVVCAALVAAWLLWGAPLHHMAIDIDAERLALAPWHGGHALGAVAGFVVALVAVLVVVLVVVPVAVLVPLLIVALVLVVVLAALAGAAALVFAPVFLLAGVVWLIWRLARRDARPAAAIPE